MTNRKKILEQKISRRIRWVLSDEYGIAVAVRKMLADVIPKLEQMLRDKEFAQVLRAAGLEFAPRICGHRSTNVATSRAGFGVDTLELIVIVKFLSTARQESLVETYINGRWPFLLKEIQKITRALNEHGFFIRRKFDAVLPITEPVNDQEVQPLAAVSKWFSALS